MGLAPGVFFCFLLFRARGRRFRPLPPDRRQQSLPLIGEVPVHHGVQQGPQGLSHSGTGEPKRQQVPSRHPQLSQGHAGALRQQLIQDGLCLVDLPLHKAIVRRLSQVVRPFDRQQPPQILLPQRRQGMGHTGPGPGDIFVVPGHQPYHRLSCGTVRPETAEHLPRQPGALRRVAVKMALALLICRKAVWLSDIMEQQGQPQFRLRPHRRQGVEGVLPHVIAVVAIPLVKSHHRQDLRPEDADDVGIRPQDLRRPVSRHQLFQLRPDALRGDVPQQRPVPVNGRRRIRVNGKPKLGGEPEAPEDPQGVLVEPAVRVPHAPEDARRKVRPASQGVVQIPRQIHCHGVDGEVPAPQILLQGVGEFHGLRPPVVPVGPVPPEGGDLHAAGRRPDGDGAVAEAGGHRPVSKQGHGLLRPGGGGHVPVLRWPAQQGVPDTAAHAPGAMARRLQYLQNFPYRGGNVHHGLASSHLGWAAHSGRSFSSGFPLAS